MLRAGLLLAATLILLGAGIAALIDDAPARLRLGARAKCRFAERLDIVVPAASLQALYREASAPVAGPARVALA